MLLAITTTDVIALYAAIVATGVLIFEIYKWKTSGPCVVLTVKSNMCIHGDSRFSPEDTFISVHATNTGNLPTSITSLAGVYYKNRFFWIINRPDRQFIIANTGFLPLPYKLEPGAVWNGIIQQDEELESLGRKGVLVCNLFLSHTSKPEVARIHLKEDEPPQAVEPHELEGTIL